MKKKPAKAKHSCKGALVNRRERIVFLSVNSINLKAF
jgi:hypothetical protein